MARLVLVHGAFGGSWVWDPVVGPLEARGHTVETFDLPGSGDDPTPAPEVTLDAYADRVCEALRSSDEPAVLVGHSMGGVVITQTAARCPERISKLIYLAAFLPRDGQSLEELTKLPEGANDQVMANLVVEGEPPVGTIPADKGHLVLFNACDEGDSPQWIEKLGRQPLVPFVTPVSARTPSSTPWLGHTSSASGTTPSRRRSSGGWPARPRATRCFRSTRDHMPEISATDETVEAIHHLASS